jgi:hypothetical protein
MKGLRTALTLLAAPACLLVHDLLAQHYEDLVFPVKHDMLGIGIGIHFAGWALVLLFPITSWLGDLWWNDRRRYVINVLLLIALTVFIAPNWSTHPYRTLLFLACCWSTLPLRWLIDRMTMAP